MSDIAITAVNSSIALIVLSVLALILALVIPLLNAIPKLSTFISLRWSCVAIILLIMVGVVVDFSHLADNTRDIILKGGIIIVGLFIIIRTIEKILYNGWLRGFNLKGSLSRGDVKGQIEIGTLSSSSRDDNEKRMLLQDKKSVLSIKKDSQEEKKDVCTSSEKQDDICVSECDLEQKENNSL